MNSDQIAQDLKKYQLWENADVEIRAYEKMLSDNAGDAEMAEEVQETVASLVAYRDSLLTAEEAERIRDSIGQSKETASEYRMRGLLFKAFDKMKEHPEALLIAPALLPWWKNIKVLSGVTTIGVIAVVGWMIIKQPGQDTGAIPPAPSVPGTETENPATPPKPEEHIANQPLQIAASFQQETPKRPTLAFSILNFQTERGDNNSIRISFNPFDAGSWDDNGLDTLRLRGKYAYAYIRNGDDVYNFIRRYKPMNEKYRLPTFDELKGLYRHDSIQVAYTKVGLEWCSVNNTEKVAIYTVDQNSGKIRLYVNQPCTLEEARNILKRNYFRRNQHINPAWITPSFRLVKTR